MRYTTGPLYNERPRRDQRGSPSLDLISLEYLYLVKIVDDCFTIFNGKTIMKYFVLTCISVWNDLITVCSVADNISRYLQEIGRLWNRVINIFFFLHFHHTPFFLGTFWSRSCQTPLSPRNENSRTIYDRTGQSYWRVTDRLKVKRPTAGRFHWHVVFRPISCR